MTWLRLVFLNKYTRALGAVILAVLGAFTLKKKVERDAVAIEREARAAETAETLSKKHELEDHYENADDDALVAGATRAK